MSGAGSPSIAVVGAAGHTGRFVLAALARRGFGAIAVGRSALALAEAHPSGEARTVSLDDAASLDDALAGAAAVVNCAGPFLDSADPVIEAAVRLRIAYFDVTAEQESVQRTFARYDGVARDAGIAIVPALGFYGGLADLMASAVLAGWGDATEIRIGVALDSWRPTRGTRLTGARNQAPRLRYTGARFQPVPTPGPTLQWRFAAPFGLQDMIELPFSETILLARRSGLRDVRSYLNSAALRDVRDPATPPPTPADDSGRSSQTFHVELIAGDGKRERRACVRGRDIYAVTAPLLVEGISRILGDRNGRRGVLTPGALPGAASLLQGLAPEHLALDLS